MPPSDGVCQVDVDHRVGPAAQIDGDEAQRLVHRHVAVRRADDAGAVAQRPIERLPQADRHILDGVVRIHVQIALRLHGQIEQAVVGEQRQHVVEEADAGVHLRLAPAVDLQGQVDLRLAGLPVNRCGTHGTSHCNAECGTQNDEWSRQLTKRRSQ